MPAKHLMWHNSASSSHSAGFERGGSHVHSVKRLMDERPNTSVLVEQVLHKWNCHRGVIVN